MAPLSWSLWPKQYLVQMLKLLAINCSRWFWKLSPCLVNTKANTSCYGFGFLDPSFITESHQGQFVPIILYYCNPKTASEFKMNSNFVKSVKKCINPSTFPLITGRNYNVNCNTFYCNNFFLQHVYGISCGGRSPYSLERINGELMSLCDGGLLFCHCKMRSILQTVSQGQIIFAIIKILE